MIKQIFIFLTILSASCNISDSTGNYGEVVRFEKDKPVKYPDFEITYLGERKQTATFPNGSSFTFTYQDFKIKSANEEKTISWTSGTGDISPAYLEAAGMQFMLELRAYENGKKRIDNDQVVITKM
ncbi:MAG: hypothetical protein L0Y79_00580 [Chlorobi bacterium]|nr:hypothetical protein [Chlorobiota bacterium]MCI0717354.1 hypothetical protein [Chlorobiota bacterium]